jgi:hypothetical protein
MASGLRSNRSLALHGSAAVMLRESEHRSCGEALCAATPVSLVGPPHPYAPSTRHSRPNNRFHPAALPPLALRQGRG